MIEFGIAHPATKEEGDWHVVGRCVTDVHVGDRFTKFVPHEKFGKRLDELQFKRGHPVTIDLKIVKIEAYGKSVNEWSAGMTARLVLKGNGEYLGEFGSLCSE